MTTTAKTLAWILGLSLVGVGVYKLTQTTLELKAFYDHIAFSAENVKITFVKQEGKTILQTILNNLIPKIRIKFDIKITNPTKTSVTFQKPFVKILYDGSELATSTITNSANKVTIQKESFTYIRDFQFDIDLGSKFSVIYDMVSKVASGVSIDRSATLKDNLTKMASVLTDNVLNQLLPLIEVNILVYAGNNPIDVKFKLV